MNYKTLVKKINKEIKYLKLSAIKNEVDTHKVLIALASLSSYYNDPDCDFTKKLLQIKK